MLVYKRDGTTEAFKESKLTARISELSAGLDQRHVKATFLSKRITNGVYDGVSTEKLVKLAAETAASMMTNHPDYSIIAARLSISDLHKRTQTKFSSVMTDLYYYYNLKTKKHQPRISKETFEVVKEHAETLDSAIVHERDFDFNYFGFKTLEKSYLLRVDDKVVERPQHMWMRVAIGIHGSDIKHALETYNLMSRRYFTHGSPTLFNAGTVNPQMASCFLLTAKYDSIEGIYDTLKECALILKSAGGIGLSIHNIRSTGTYIAGTNGTSNGILPMLRVFNDTARYVDQGGNKRPGAIAVYLEPWHCDIFDFIDIRKNHGKEEMRARDLFPALWIPDLFMERVQKNEYWSLFSPNEAPGLQDVYGDEFKNLYEKYEGEGRARQKIKAQKLWHSILDAQTETGTPFMLYKDACNLKSNQKNLGTIRSSNLCCEIVEFSNPGETAVCNLGSIALPAFVNVSDNISVYNFKKLHQIAKILTRNLNNVIDKSAYPVEGARKSNLKHRPIALGVQGLADLFAILRIPFDSEEARELNIQIFETIYHGAVEASMELAREYGPYESFNSSPASKGLLQFDLWEVKPTPLWEWNSLKAKVVSYGLRNSLLVAPMPTASTSQILGYNECFEPFTSNVYCRRVLAGEFQIVNPYLLKDLVDLDLWNEDMKNHIIANNGSIQSLTNVPHELKALYKTVWEISQKTIIDMAAERAPFIDQSQSLNIHIKDPTMGKLTSMHFYGWRKGLKTGMYYLRTQAASAAIQFTVDRNSAKRANSVVACSTELMRPVYKRRRVEASLTDNVYSSSNSSMDESTDDLEGDTLIEGPVENSSSKDIKYSGDIYSDEIVACAIEHPASCDLCSG